MEQPQHSTAFAGGNSRRWRTSAPRYLSYAGLATSNIYEFSMIYGGLISTALLPINPLFSSNATAAGIAAIVSAAIITFYLCFTWIFPTFRWVVVGTLGVVLVLMAAFFSFFALSLNAHGDDAVRAVEERIAAARHDLTNIDEGITRIYTAQLAALEQSRTDSCAGRDETLIPICGTISKTYLRRATTLRNTYGALLAASVLSDDTKSSDLGEGLNRVEVDARSLNPKVAAFARFSQEAGIVTIETPAAFTRVTEDIQKVRLELPNGSPTARDIVLQQSFADLSALFRAAARPAVYLRAVVAALPALLSIFFALVLANIDATQSPEQLEREIRAAKTKTSLVEKLATAQQGLSRAFTKLWGARIEAEVAGSVASSANKNCGQRLDSTPEGD